MMILGASNGFGTILEFLVYIFIASIIYFFLFINEGMYWMNFILILTVKKFNYDFIIIGFITIEWKKITNQIKYIYTYYT